MRPTQSYSSFTVPYPTTLLAASSKTVNFAVNSFHMLFTNGRMNYATSLGNATSSTFSLSLSTSTPAQLTAIDVRYLVLTNSYAADNIQLLANTITITGNFSISSTQSTSATYNINNFNTTGGISSFVSIIGMDVTSSSGNLVNLGTTVSTQSTNLLFTVSSTSSTPTLMNSLTLSFVIFNTGYFNRANFAAFSAGSLSGSASSSRLLQAWSLHLTNSNINPSTTLVGMNKFGVSGSNFLNYNVAFGSTNSFSVTSQNPSNSLSINYLLLPTYYCGIATPYKVVDQNICVSQCPSGYVTN